MLSIALVNMPFASLELPSLALTQLKHVTETDPRLAGRVQVDVRYASHEFGRLLGCTMYQGIADSLEHHSSGLGDWFFRGSAFPGAADTTPDYFRRYYRRNDESTKAFLRTALENRELVDGFLDQLIDAWGLDTADIIGLTSMFTQNVACFAMARKVKVRNPNAIVVMGGANCESPMGQAIIQSIDAVDYVFSGPSLSSFPTFVDLVLAGDRHACDRIDGVLSRGNRVRSMPHASASVPVAESEGSASLPEVGPLGKELSLDHVIPLDYAPFLNMMDAYFPEPEVSRVLLFETSRGCWWGERSHCTFCGLNGASMNYRAMSSDLAVQQFRDLFEYAPKVQRLRLQCVDNILPKSYFSEVLPRLATPRNVDIFYEVKADLTDANVRTLADARVVWIQPGIEALATSTLKLMRKGTSAFQNIRLLQHCATHDVWPYWNLLVGFPDEQEDVFDKYVADIPKLIHLPPPSGAHPVRFDRFSPYFVNAEQYGLALRPLDYYELLYPLSGATLAQLAYYFGNDNEHKSTSFLALARSLPSLRTLVANWRARWSRGARETPRLYLRECTDGYRIYDSRGSAILEYPVDEVVAALLAALATQQKKVTALHEELPGFAAQEVDRAVAFVVNHALVFEEGDRLLSLVLASPPAGEVGLSGRLTVQSVPAPMSPAHLASTAHTPSPVS